MLLVLIKVDKGRGLTHIHKMRIIFQDFLLEPIPLPAKTGNLKLSTVKNYSQQSIVNSQQSTINSQQSTVNSQQSTVSSKQ